MILTAQAIADLKDFLDRTFAYAIVKINGTDTKYPIKKRERLSNGRVAVYIDIAPHMSNARIQKVSLYNINKQLWCEKTEDIVTTTSYQGALYRFVFDFTEIELEG